MTNYLAKQLIFLGIILVLIGVIILLAGKTPFFGRMPGDIIIKRENFTFVFPIISCVLISIVISIVVNLFLRK